MDLLGLEFLDDPFQVANGSNLRNPIQRNGDVELVLKRHAEIHDAE
jgi:hypothetical protein